MKLERIIPEIKTLTTGIYYKQLQELVDFLMKHWDKDIWKYKIVCDELLYNECKTIGIFFQTEVLKTNHLPEGTLIACVNFYELLNNNANYIF